MAEKEKKPIVEETPEVVSEEKTSLINEDGTFIINHNTYRFVETAPEKIRFQGEIYTQEEMVSDENIILSLIKSNSSLIEEI